MYSKLQDSKIISDFYRILSNKIEYVQSSMLKNVFLLFIFCYITCKKFTLIVGFSINNYNFSLNYF